ncbi:GC-rich sequence DNA-binding factor-like domain [Arabidopsis suecica]|uniref:GC-rich sequence DNA-binding factor-like domain n=1 Tax=Arabidopsis suecica TaxID=45249 RepID=A0A8T2DH64_ARASU|nr:GC-rich sequence DNA-binding factor-like domain [Arabidopsis suecica]
MGTKQPRNYRRRCNDEIDGEDATAAAKPSSSDLYPAKPSSSDLYPWKRRKLPAIPTKNDDDAKGRDHAKSSWLLDLSRGDEFYTQEQMQQRLKEHSRDERPMEIVFNGERVRSIGMDGLSYVFVCPMPQTADDKMAALDRICNAYDERVNSRMPQEQPQMYAGRPEELAKEPDENLTMSIAAAESCPSAHVYKYASLQEISDFKSVFRNFMQKNGYLITAIEDQMKVITERHASAILEKRKQVDGYSLIVEADSSTDDESDSETSAFKEARDSLLQRADKIFNDASVVYSELSRVKSIFKRGARHPSPAFRAAYTSLTVPSMYSPYLRLELLRWDPLHQDVDFSDMNWHGLLFHSRIVCGSTPVCTNPNFVSELVKYVAVPILHHRIVRCWDILSTRETRNVVAATSLVARYVFPSSEALAELSLAIHARLVEAIIAISVPTWDPQVSKDVPNAPQVAAYRFGTSVRLMRNICMWKDVMELPVLEKLALSDLLFGKVLPHVRSIASESNIHDAVTKTERIVASLSGIWTGPTPSVTRTHR